MLPDFHELARAALADAIEDHKGGNEARILDRDAFRKALDAAHIHTGATDDALQKQLDAAGETLKQEQHDDDRALLILKDSVPAALAKLAELASL
jgi:hypothetical protein